MNIHEGSDAIEHLENVISAGHQARHQKLAELMKTTRQQSGLTQSELADRLGVTQSWVSKMESGSNHTIDNIVDYFEAMNYQVKLSICKEHTIEL